MLKSRGKREEKPLRQIIIKSGAIMLFNEDSNKVKYTKTNKDSSIGKCSEKKSFFKNKKLLKPLQLVASKYMN